MDHPHERILSRLANRDAISICVPGVARVVGLSGPMQHIEDIQLQATAAD